MTSKPVNCFLLYCQDYRAKIASFNPTFSNSEVTSQLGKNWRNMDPKMKQFYISKAEFLRTVSNNMLFNLLYS